MYKVIKDYYIERKHLQLHYVKLATRSSLISDYKILATLTMKTGNGTREIDYNWTQT